jgi:hypothetical protein
MAPAAANSKVGTMTHFDMSSNDLPRQRMGLSMIGRSNTLSVFESGSRPLGSESIAMAQSSLKMSIMNVRIVSDETGLPKEFDIEKVKAKWMDSKTCQL